MLKSERNKIRKAIWFIHTNERDGGDYDKGMEILMKLAGLSAPRLEGEIEGVDIREVITRKEPTP